MSYDIAISIEPAPGRFVPYMYLGNMTSNVAPMWRIACPSLDGLAGIDGKTGAEVSASLIKGLRFMYRQRREVEKLNPSNGWGNFPAAFRYFANITRMAIAHPEAKFEVSR